MESKPSRYDMGDAPWYKLHICFDCGFMTILHFVAMVGTIVPGVMFFRDGSYMVSMSVFGLTASFGFLTYLCSSMISSCAVCKMYTFYALGEAYERRVDKERLRRQKEMEKAEETRRQKEINERVRQYWATEKAEKARRKEEAVAKETATRKTCDSCLLSIIVIEACGASMLLFANIWPSSGTADIVGMTVFCAQFFIAALYLLYARKNCDSCLRLNHPQGVSTNNSNIAVEDASKENDRSEPMNSAPTVERESKFAQKARWLLADIHNIMSGSSVAEPEQPVRIATECQDSEGCEKAVAEYLADQKVTGELLMNGLYAAKIARAVNYPYEMVRAVLEKLGKRAFVRVLNQSLVVRDYNA